jgi:multidrug efflux pump subunit AcrB
MTVEARNPDVPAPMLLAAVQPALDALGLPAGYRFEIGGEIEDQREANEKLFGLLPLALAAIVLLLVGQFNSFRKGGIILATIPLIVIGGTLGLFVMDAPYGFMVLLGFFSLAGILINNGIVLIDRIEFEQAAGSDPLEAVVIACLARLRPILMATLTTVLGLIPLILFGGALFYGMASVIAFGLIVATIFTLGFVPALYTLLFRIPTAAARETARTAALSGANSR